MTGRCAPTCSCAALCLPTYADLRTAAHLQTFDVRDGGAALWGEGGKLFLVNVFHQSQAGGKQAASKTSKEKLLRHVTLDPPLQPQEAAEVEQIKLNASSSQVLLQAKSWLRLLRLPVETKRKPQSALQRRADNDITQRFLVRFEDGSEQEITLKEDELKDADMVTQVRRRAAQGKRVAFVSREHCVASVRTVGYFSNVRHAAWHPLSDTHVVVLSDAEEIEVFNTQQDVSKPEQRHRLDFPTKARATGPSQRASVSVLRFSSSSNRPHNCRPRRFGMRSRATSCARTAPCMLCAPWCRTIAALARCSFRC